MDTIKSKIIVITREKSKSEELYIDLKDIGVTVVMLPCIKIIPVDDYNEFDSVLKEISFDFVIFSSANSVDAYAKRIKGLGFYNRIKAAKIICVGSKTKEQCERFNIHVDLLPQKFSAKGMLELLVDSDLTNKKILLPSSYIARTELSDGLKDRGAKVYNIPVYNVVLPDKSEIIEELEFVKANKPDMVIFSSPSTFDNYLQLLEIEDASDYFSDVEIAAIGTTTRESIEAKGLNVSVIPKTFTTSSLVESVKEFYTQMN